MARANLQIKVGTYTGDGSDDRTITGIGFRPQLVLIKGGNNIATYRNNHYIGDASNLFAGSGTNVTDHIQELTADGFQVGTNARVNANATVYYYVAIRGTSAQSHFRTGKYRGSGADNRDFTTGGLNFTPDFVFTKIDGATIGSFRTSSMSGDTTGFFSANANAANAIQNLQSNGFQLGTASEANGAFDYYFFAMAALSGVFKVGTYTGTGATKSITGLGFSPSLVIVKNATSAIAARMLTTDMVTNAQTSVFLTTTATDANGITSLDTDGFTVGTGTATNENGSVMHWVALKSGNFNAPITRLTA